jgi:dTDP-4-amino-4,6-dideoxygalactose transaminase
MINVTKPDLPPVEEYVEFLKQIWENRWLTNYGPLAQLFERRLRDHLRVKDLIIVANGTLALLIALRALDLKGEVITTPFTFATTTNVLVWEGLTPVFADIDPKTFNIDPIEVEKKISKSTSAILATHVYGNPCHVEMLAKIARKHDLKLVYDAAHAFDVEYDNHSVLDYGDISTLSFHATKVFTTGEGGAIVAKNEKLLKKMQLLIDHGIASEERIILPGINAKMNEFQAALGLCGLDYVVEKIRSRKRLHELYNEQLAGSNIIFQEIIASKYNYAYMPIALESRRQRDMVYAKLLRNGIKSRKYFFPLTIYFDYFQQKGIDLVEYYDLRHAADIASRILCLPMYADLESSIVDDICKIIKGKKM